MRRRGFHRRTPIAVVSCLAIMLCLLPATSRGQGQQIGDRRADIGPALFARHNLIAWCIVPFDSKRRSPEDRAAMLQRLGFKHFAYDWRPEHIPSFDAEISALKEHGIALDAVWVAPGELNRESRLILDVLKRRGIKAQLWVLLDLGTNKVTGGEQERRVAAAAGKLMPLALEAGKIGCSIGLYNHGGWFGEPENQVAILEALKAQGVTNIGLVYNLHHGHDHLDRFPAILRTIKPYLMALNLNGMDPEGDRVGRKILPLGQGAKDLELLRVIRDSGYRGPIGVLGHTMDDAEERLRDNLDGLDWLVPQLEGKPKGPAPKPRTPVPPRRGAPAAAATTGIPFPTIAALVAEARQHGDARRGAGVFLDPRHSCSSCHKVGNEGGSIGPDLTTVGVCLKPEEIVEAVLLPRSKVKEGYRAIAVSTVQGGIVQGYRQGETSQELSLREATTGRMVHIPRSSIEEARDLGTLMPEGLLIAMSTGERSDLLRFLMDLGKPGNGALASLRQHAHEVAAFPYQLGPIAPDRWPNRRSPVNRERLYDFYAKEAEYFRTQASVPLLLPPYPGLDGGTHGHWGNQNEEAWADARWNQTDLGQLLSGVFHGPAGLTVAKGVCIRLGEHGELSACFNPQTLSYEAVWSGGFVKFSAVRHGFLDGLIMDGTPLPAPARVKPTGSFLYRGFYRHGKRVIFAYRVGDRDYLDAPWVEDGKFTHVAGPAETHPLAYLTKGGSPLWPHVIRTKGTLGRGRPYAVDTITPPFENPWKSLLFFGDHDFHPDGSALLCTMEGDVWKVDGLDAKLDNVRWRRVASGLHQALGLVVSNGTAYVLGRDQITRLNDLDGDGEADFYECVTNAYDTSPAGHDFICGLQLDAAGYFYTASGKQGILKIPPDGRTPTVVATGFRNPDGLGLSSTGVLTVPNSEGDWVPTSSVSEVRSGGHYGHGGPRNGVPPDLPLVYLPRGLDNSSGAQVEVPDGRWGPLQGQLIHLSYGAGTSFLILREQVDGQPQGAAVPLAGDFDSGVHRGRFNPKDGQLYVSGMGGWGTYTRDDGCFQRVRYTGTPVQIPAAFHAHENGVLLTFTSPLDRAIAERSGNQFLQAWNYRYSNAYGSPELSPRHPGVPGHDPISIRSAHVLADGKSLFLELPDLQPVNQLHMHLRVDSGDPQDLYATVHKLAAPFTGFPGYQPAPKTIAAHPILADMASLTARKIENPSRRKIPGAREVTIAAGKNLSYTVSSFRVRAGEAIKLVFNNPDVVPHNWALARPGSLARVGDLVNKVIAEPDAAIRNYIPKSDDVIVYVDITDPGRDSIIHFRAPDRPGHYPYLCTFPGHWMVMNGVMTVE